MSKTHKLSARMPDPLPQSYALTTKAVAITNNQPPFDEAEPTTNNQQPTTNH